MEYIKKKYLLCPQCGDNRLFVKNNNGERVFFHVDYNKNTVRTENSNADLNGHDLSVIQCAGCSWSGIINKLKEYFY